MIESLPNSKFIVIGEPKVHNNLQDLLEYHQTVYNHNKLCILKIHYKKFLLSINCLTGMVIYCIRFVLRLANDEAKK